MIEHSEVSFIIKVIIDVVFLDTSHGNLEVVSISSDSDILLDGLTSSTDIVAI